MPLSVGDRLGPYEILAPLGAGGFGEVWKARDTRLGRIVAVKRLTGPRPAGFEHEARTIAALNHPHICHLYDIGPDYLVMEYVDGKPLRGPRLVEETVRLGIEIASALAEAHSHGILHRDLKPNNIMLTSKGAAKLVDFGLAKVAADDPEATRTMDGRLLGTPSYMSPEQARGQPVDARSDLFALGAVLYECLTGRRAFPGASSVGVLLEVVSSEPPPPSSIAPAVPPRLDAIVQKLLAKDRAARYASADEAIAALRECQTAAASGTAVSRALERPHRLVAPGAIMLAVLALAVVAWLASRSGGGKAQTRQVVVLPFESLSVQPEGTAFGDGLAEVVAGLLTRRDIFPDTLWVVPSTDVRRFGVQTVADAGRTFHANLAIGGTVQRTPDPPGWLITIAASDAAQPHLLASRTIRVEDRDPGALEPNLISALVAVLAVRGRTAAQAAKAAPSNYAQFVVARGHLRHYDRDDNLKLAISELERITTATPDYAPALTALSEACFRMYSATKQEEWLAKADQALRRAADIDESDPGIPVMRGRILRATGETEAAIRELRLGLAHNPGDEVALLQLAGAYESAKRFPEAEATYQEAIRLRPSYFPAYTNLGIFYMSQGKWKQSEDALTIVTKLAPDYADGHTTLGTLFYHLDRLDEAQREYTRSIELKPTGTAFSNRCAVEFDQRSMDAATADCRRAVSLQPASPIAWGNLADTLAQGGKSAEAVDAYRQALQAGDKLLAINPSNPDLLAAMAGFAAKAGQKPLAVELAGKAVRLGKSMNTLYYAGKAYGLAGECSRALDLLTQAFGKGYPRQEARRDPDLARLRAAPLACAVPPI
ncbi:MAG TPA: protein kinase [Bryobacteraceae bacterium]|nr:protein kinase [Bryobacteraceae bacterium]